MLKWSSEQGLWACPARALQTPGKTTVMRQSGVKSCGSSRWWTTDTRLVTDCGGAQTRTKAEIWSQVQFPRKWELWSPPSETPLSFCPRAFPVMWVQVPQPGSSALAGAGAARAQGAGKDSRAIGCTQSPAAWKQGALLPTYSLKRFIHCHIATPCVLSW